MKCICGEHFTAEDMNTKPLSNLMMGLRITPERWCTEERASTKICLNWPKESKAVKAAMDSGAQRSKEDMPTLEERPSQDEVRE